MKKLLLKTILVAAAMCVGTSAWAEATVQNLGSDEIKSLTFTSSQTDILSGSTLTLDGMVMTFMGTNNTWKWFGDNNGMLGQNTPGSASNSYYKTWLTSDGIPTYGSVYKFEASANGIVYLGGKTASNKYYIVKDNSGTLTVIKEVDASAGWADIKFEMKSGETYYFFQLGSGLNAGRYTLTTVSYTKWSDINLTAVSEPKTWNYAALKAAQNNLGQSTDGTIWVKNMTDDSGNSRLKFQTTLASNPTVLGEDMVAFKAGVDGQVYMRLADYNATVSVYDGTSVKNFEYNSKKDGSSPEKAGYHAGSSYYKYASFQVTEGTQYYIYRTSTSGGSPNAGIYYIEFQPTGNNTTTALTEATTWNFVTQNDILTEYHGITKDNMFFGDGITDVFTSGIGYRITFNGTGNTATGANVLSFKLPANVKGYVSLNPNCFHHKLVLKADDTTLKEFKTGGDGDHNKDISVWVTTDAETTIYLYCPENSVTSNFPGTRYITWTPAPENVSATIGTNGYTTFSSAYPLALGSMTASTGTVTAYYAKAVGDGKVTMKSIEKNVEAGEGLILKGTAGATITIPVAASGSSIDNYLVGCPTETVLSANANCYVLVNNGGTAEFQCLDTNGATIPAGKAYLNVATAGARLSVVFDEETTGVQELKNSRIEGLKTGNYYNLSGQRVDQPQKGLYIVNGKKVVVK